MRILLVTPFVPRPDMSAGDRRLFLLLGLLAADHQVDVLPLCFDTEEPDEQARYVAAAEAAGARVLMSDSSMWFNRVVTRSAYAVILFEFWYSAIFDRLTIARRSQPWAAVVVDTVDVHYLRETAGAALGWHDAEKVRRDAADEQDVYRQADVVISVSEDDTRELRRLLGPDKPVVTIPLVQPARPARPVPPAAGVSPIISFVGGGLHLPNVDAIRWFVADILPRVRSAVGDATLRIVGAELPPAVIALGGQPGVEVVGAVPEVEPYLAEAAVSVAPLRFGGGMKGKVVEAMAAGVPVVTTPVGAQGLGPLTGEELIVAETPEAFADGVVRLLGDPALAHRVGLAGRARVEAVCGTTAVRRELAALYRIVGTPAHRPPRFRPTMVYAALRFYFARRYLRSLVPAVNRACELVGIRRDGRGTAAGIRPPDA